MHSAQEIFLLTKEGTIDAGGWWPWLVAEVNVTQMPEPPGD
jgi:hypothetical protein